MGQKVNPIGFRTGIMKKWASNWYANKKDFGRLLVQDVSLRKHVKDKFYNAGIASIEIERSSDEVVILVNAARPALIIGRKGGEVERLRKDLEVFTGVKVDIKVKEVKKPEVEAQLIAESVREQLEQRQAFRRAMKKSVEGVMGSGARGIRIVCSGRLGGSEMARCEKYAEGKLPMHTLRADIDYGFTEAMTAYGKIGIKVWIYRGDYKIVKNVQQKKAIAVAVETAAAESES